MKRIFLFTIAIVVALSTQAAKKEKKQEVDSLGRKIKTSGTSAHYLR